MEAKTENKQLTFKSTIDSYNKDEHSIVFIISNGSVDHQQEIVNPKGMFFRKQPKGLYNHNYNIPAVTKLLWVKYDPASNNIKAKFEFDQNDPFAVLLENKYANGFMTDVSVGFLTDLEALEINSDGFIVHNKWELLEVSLVNIGANLEAVALTLDECNSLMKSKAFSTSLEMKGYVEDLKEKIMIRDITKSVTESFESKLLALQAEIDGLKENDSSCMTASDIEITIDKKLDDLTPKFNEIIKEINKLKSFKNNFEIKSIIGSV